MKFTQTALHRTEQKHGRASKVVPKRQKNEILKEMCNLQVVAETLK